MRKYMLLILVIAVVLSFAGVSVAAELAATTGVVGEDIEIGEGEMKIVSQPDDQGDGGGTDAVAPIAPDELLLEEQKRVDAANGGSEAMDNDPGIVFPFLILVNHLQTVRGRGDMAGKNVLIAY